MFKIGRVTRYYDKLGLAIFELDGMLSVGDEVKFFQGEDLFTQKVDSIQIGHEKKPSASKGEVIGLKTNEKVKAGTEIFKIG